MSEEKMTNEELETAGIDESKVDENTEEVLDEVDENTEEVLDEVEFKPKGSKKKKIIIIAVIVVILLLIVFRVMSNGKQNQPMMVPEKTSINVQTVAVDEGELNAYVTISGTITPKSEVYVVPKVSGKVTAVYVELGQWVNKGQRLFSIDKTDVKAQLDTAAAAVESAKAAYERTVGGSAEQTVAQLEAAVETSRINYENAKTSFERTQALYDVGGVAEQAYEQAKSGYELAEQQYTLAQKNYDLTVNKILGENEKTARAALDQAQAGYQSALNAYNNTEVVAEVSGYVGTMNAVVGGMVSSAQPPMSIVDISEVYADVGLPETVINKVSPNGTVDVSVANFADRVFNGRIVGISPSTAAGTQTYQTKIAIDNTSGDLKGGMFASVKFKVETSANTLFVPVSAVKEENQESYVFVVTSEKTAAKRIVTTGISNDNNVEITSGLKRGDIVVTSGQDFLDDGTPVTVIGEKKS